MSEAAESLLLQETKSFHKVTNLTYADRLGLCMLSLPMLNLH